MCSFNILNHSGLHDVQCVPIQTIQEIESLPKNCTMVHTNLLNKKKGLFCLFMLFKINLKKKQFLRR